MFRMWDLGEGEGWVCCGGACDGGMILIAWGEMVGGGWVDLGGE